MILLLTQQDDLTADLVVIALKRLGAPFLRLNVDQLLISTFLDCLPNGSVWYQDEATEHFDLSRVRTIWYRSHSRPRSLESIPTDAASFAAREAVSQMYGALFSLDARWVNEPAAVWRASHKPLQLSVASRCGFRVPSTLITRRPDKAASFVKANPRPAIAKPVSYGLLASRDGDQAIYTTRIPSDSADYHDIQFAPVIIQDEIPKRCDIRVTVIDDAVIAVAIDSQVDPATVTDWRRPSASPLPHRVVELPRIVADSCRTLTSRLGLTFGAIDLIEDTSGDHFFLEINPNGQWGWLDVDVGTDIAATLAASLSR